MKGIFKYVLIAGGIYVVYKLVTRKSKETIDFEEKQNAILWKDDSLPLQKYSSGPNVLALQKILNINATTKLEEDGKFGSLTEAELYRQYKTKIANVDFFNQLIAKSQQTETDAYAPAPEIEQKLSFRESFAWFGEKIDSIF